MEKSETSSDMPRVPVGPSLRLTANQTCTCCHEPVAKSGGQGIVHQGCGHPYKSLEAYKTLRSTWFPTWRRLGAVHHRSGVVMMGLPRRKRGERG